jgi:hypothetical protein
LGRRKKPPALPSAVSTTYSGPTASSPSYGQDTAVEPNGGRSCTATSTLPTGQSGGGVICACLYLVGSPKDQLWLLLGPWPDSSMPRRGRLRHRLVSAVEPAAGHHSARHIVRNIRSRGRLRLGPSYTHIHTTGMPLPRLGSSSWPRHLRILCAGNWGPQLQFMSMTDGSYAPEP